MANAMFILPEAEGEELRYIQSIFDRMDDDSATNFAQIYRSRRKNPQEILIFALIGLLGIGGIQRFVLNQPAMGLLFLLTAGLCYIGTIIDIINYRQLAFEYNRRIADEIVLSYRH